MDRIPVRSGLWLLLGDRRRSGQTSSKEGKVFCTKRVGVIRIPNIVDGSYQNSCVYDWE